MVGALEAPAGTTKGDGMSVIEHWKACSECGYSGVRRGNALTAGMPCPYMDCNGTVIEYVPAADTRGAVEQIAELERLLHQANTEREDWKRWCLDHEAEVGRLRAALGGR